MKIGAAAFLMCCLIFSYGTVYSNDDSSLSIVASFSIIEDIVQQVVGDITDVSVVIPAGADPHTFSPSPRDLAALAEADIVFVNGLGYEAVLIEAIENAGAEMNIVEVSACVPARIVGEDHEEEHHDENEEHEDAQHNEADHELDQSAGCQFYKDIINNLLGSDFPDYEMVTCELETDHEESHDNADDHEHEGECDPHVWTDPMNVMYWVLQVRDTLSSMNPEHAEIYASNADAYLEQLMSLRQDFVIPAFDSIPEENRKLITNHDAFGYLAELGELEVVGVIIPGGSTLSEPNAGDIAALIERIRTEDVPAIFTETTVGSVVAEQIASETGASIQQLYSGSLSEGEPAGTYIDMSRYNVTTIVEALGGSTP